ncbi:MAG: hypothetical protein LBJ88_06635 [Campylobacteraceae bacterium]|nr:hypothetical protein [Campylobacteraceae bacterium]
MNIIWVENYILLHILMIVMWGGAAIGAFITAYLAYKHKIILGTSIAVISAILAVVVNFLFYEITGKTDFPGVNGAKTFFFIMLVFYSPQSLFFSTIAYLIIKNDYS